MRHLNESSKCEFIQANVKKIFDFKSSLIFPQKIVVTKNPVQKFHSPAWVYNLFYGGVGLVMSQGYISSEALILPSATLPDFPIFSVSIVLNQGPSRQL